MSREERCDLASRYLDATLEEGDEVRLDALLARDPGFARLLAEFSLQDAFLHRLVRTEHLVPHDLPEAEALPFARRRPVRRRRAGSAGGPLWPWLAAAAAILVFLAVLAGPSRHPAPRDLAGPPAPPIPIVRPEPPSPAPPPLPDLPRPRDFLPPPPAPPTPVPAPAPAPAAPDEAPASPARETPRPTIVAVAKAERVEGEVFLADGAALAAGVELLPGRAVRTGPRGRATLRFGDGSVLELGPDGEITELSDGPKRVVLGRGLLAADVVRQPSGRPMILATPGAESAVLGTRFVLSVEAEGTRLDVRSGRVRLTRLSDGAAVEVPGGHYSVVGAAGPLAAWPSRALQGLVALWTFEEGRGTSIRDVSRVGAPLDLRIRDEEAVRWRPGALSIQRPTIVSSLRPAAKIVEACRRSQEFTLEAWIRPASPTNVNHPETGRIVTLSSDLYTRNFALEQGEPGGGAGTCYGFRLRTSETTPNGFPPEFRTELGTLSTRLSHVVCARDASGLTRVYVDGREAGRRSYGGTFAGWSEAFHLHLADELGGQRAWTGEYHLLAIYGRALTSEEALRHARAGPDWEAGR